MQRTQVNQPNRTIETPLKTLTQAISPKNSPSSGCQNDPQTSSEHVNSNFQNAANTVLNASASSFVPGDISVLSAHDDSPADQSHSSSLPDEDLFTYCIQSCMYDRKDCGQPMTRCCLCMLWNHNNCSADTDEQIQASPIWYCSVCRQLPKMLTLELTTLRQNNSKLIDTVSLLQSENMKLREKLESSKLNHNQHHTLLTDSTKLHHKIDTLENANIKLSTELAELSAEYRRLRSNSDKLIDHSSLNSGSSSSNKKLLLGSSMIRDFNPNTQSNIEVKCIRGAQSDDLSDFLKKNECTYNQVILVVGSNDCSTKLTAEEVVLKMKNLACVAQRFSKQPVILSSICPRTDNPSFQMKAESVNAALSACDTSGFLFVNNDPSFRLQDDTINDGYLHKDGHHFPIVDLCDLHVI